MDEPHKEIDIDLYTSPMLKDTAKLYATTFADAYPSEQWTEKPAEKFIEFMHKLQPDLFFVAKQQDHIIGGVWGLIKPYVKGNIICDTELFVAKEYQHQGISKMLLRKIVKEALELYQIYLFIGIANRDEKFPMSYYERLGFVDDEWTSICASPQELLKNLSD